MEMTIDDIKRFIDKCFVDYATERITVQEFKRKVKGIIDLIPES